MCEPAVRVDGVPSFWHRFLEGCGLKSLVWDPLSYGMVHFHMGVVVMLLKTAYCNANSDAPLLPCGNIIDPSLSVAL